MKTSFFEMNVAMTGLFTAKNGLSVTAHNMANASNPHYSRQVALQRASKPIALYNGRGMVGTGSEVYGVGQIRSFYLDKKYWGKNATLGEYKVKSELLTLSETIFNPLSETGINASFDNFFNSLKDLGTSSNDSTYRTNVLQTAKTFSTYINTTYKNLQKQQTDINMELSATVSIVNSLGLKIRNLNEQIQKYEHDGSNANDLRDQRALCIDELSKYANIEVKEQDNKLTVMLNGNEFVKGLTVRSLEVRERKEKLNPEDVGGLYDIYWYGGDEKFDMYNSELSGELRALVDMRDGNNRDNLKGTVTSLTESAGKYTLTLKDVSRLDILQSGVISLANPATGIKKEYTYESFTVNSDNSVSFTLKDMNSNDAAKYTPGTKAASAETTQYKGIPYYISRLNDMVRTFSKAINEGLDYKGDKIPGVIGHIDGYDLNNENSGYLLFTYSDSYGNEIEKGSQGDYYKMTAGNFTISSFLMQNPEYIAASSEAQSGESNNEVINNFSKIQTYKSLFREGTIYNYSISMSTEMGIDLKQANNFYDNYSDVVSAVDEQRMSVMSVDPDEEGMNLIRYEQLYQTAAKLINVIDRMYDTLINGLGA